MSKLKTKEVSWTAGRGYSRIVRKNFGSLEGEFCLEGTVVTPLGIVWVFSQQNTSYIEVVKNGRAYRKTIYRGYTKRGLATAAHRYVRELFGRIEE